jgi:hypothetical protein
VGVSPLAVCADPQRISARDVLPDAMGPYFREYMTLADVYRYPGQHYDHHRRQLTLTKLN